MVRFRAVCSNRGPGTRWNSGATVNGRKAGAALPVGRAAKDAQRPPVSDPADPPLVPPAAPAPDPLPPPRFDPLDPPPMILRAAGVTAPIAASARSTSASVVDVAARPAERVALAPASAIDAPAAAT